MASSVGTGTFNNINSGLLNADLKASEEFFCFFLSAAYSYSVQTASVLYLHERNMCIIAYIMSDSLWPHGL